MHDQDPNWFSGGGQAWEVLRRETEVLRTVNRWLTAPERLAKGYELVVRRLADVQKIASELQGPLEDALGKLRSDPKASITEQADAVLKKWMASRNAAGILSEIILQDITSKTEVSHRDIGQGISQVLPVLVSAYALKEHIIAIEQPELHLHPALQAELGDVFIESALGERANKFLIESHSEYLLLRIMRRMKETHRGKLPAGLCQVRPDDVAVLYVEPVGTRSIVREMPLNEQGELVKDWPGGFFEEGLREVLM
jgi:predicted ATPase